MRRTRLAAVALVLVGGAVACGDGGPGEIGTASASGEFAAVPGDVPY